MLKIEPLSSHHDRESFDCGQPDLEDYLKRIARQHAEKGVSRTFVIVDDAEPGSVLGFMTLALCEIIPSALPPKFAKKYAHRVHGVKLARLAISSTRQRQGLGALMILHAMDRARSVADNAGIVGFFVDAKDTQAQAYYLRYGFIPLVDDPLRLFLPLATLNRALEK
jgi:GNAT superfamily N-acetyltransferase